MLLSNIPYINLINILFCIGFWLGGVIAVGIYKARIGIVTVKQGIVIGLFTGLFSGLVGFGLSFIGLAGMGALVNSMSQFISADITKELKTELIGIAGILFNICGVIIDIVFGILGGIIGGVYFQKK